MNKLSSNNSFFSKSSVIYIIAMVACALVISFTDSLLPQGVSVGEAYALLVLIGFMSKDNRMVIAGAIVGTILTLEGFYISEESVALWIAWTNRLLAISIIWVVAVFAFLQIRFLEDQKESEKMKKAYERLQEETTYSKLLKEIVILCNSSDSVEEVLKQSMQKICEFTGWPVAHIYISHTSEDMLNSSKLWVLDDWSLYKEFKDVTESTDFRPGVGLPGRVLTSKKTSLIKDLSKDSNFPRARIALGNGLKSGLAFPVLIGPRIIAVMEFYSKDQVEEDAKMIAFTETLSFLLGRPFERDHAGLRKEEYENHLRRLYSRMKAVRDEERGQGDSQRTADNIHDELR